MSESTLFATVERIGKTFVLANEAVRLEAADLVSRQGRLSAVVTVQTTEGIAYTGTVKLTDEPARHQLVEKLRADGVAVSDTILLSFVDGIRQHLLTPVPEDEALAVGSGKESAATALVRLVLESETELFRSPANDAYISLREQGHQETYPLKSRAVRQWMARKYYEHTGKTPNTNAVQDARNTLEGQACFAGETLEVSVRVARTASALYLDLGDASWAAVEITAAGWSVVPTPPVRFLRPNGLLALPVPDRGGSLMELRPFLNVGTDDDFTLLVASLIGALRAPRESTGTYPITALVGEEGTAKSGAQKVLRSMIDPVTALLRSAPQDERDLMVAAKNGYVVSFDNLSSLSDKLSDSLCKLASGGALGARQLYTDDEESILTAHRPIFLNSITDVITRGDLLSRTISVTLPRIPEARRQTEGQFWPAFRAAHPRILGALLDAAVMALSREQSVVLEQKPRLADFAAWVVAAEPACPWAAGAFLRAFNANQQAAVESSFDGNPVIEAVKQLPMVWTGTCKELLEKINAEASDGAKRLPSFPKTPNAVGAELRRRAPGLFKIGINVIAPSDASGAKGRSKGRQYTILRSEPASAADQDGRRDDQDDALSNVLSNVPSKPYDFRPISDNQDDQDDQDDQNPTKSFVSSPLEDGNAVLF